jgi:diguanylate cyclase (GGDEF)-like protein
MRADGRFAKSLRGVINLGVPPAMSPETAKYIQMSNLGSLMMAGVNVPYMVLCALNGWVMVFVTVAMGRGTLLPLLIFFTAGGVVTLLRRNRTALMVAGLAAIFGTYLAALALERSIGPLYLLSPAQGDTLRRLVEYSIFVLIIVNALIGRFGAIVAEDRLREEKKRSESLLEQVREQDRQKTRFFQNVSHELRTPLTLIVGPLEAMLSGADGPMDERHRHRLELMSRNAKRLLRLINQLLDLSRIDVGAKACKPRWGDLAGFVGSLAQSFSPYAAKRGIRLSLPADVGSVKACFDPEIVEKVVSNLLSNACKFTPAGGVVTVTVTENAEDRATLITVKDTGVGIQPEELGRIFDRFYQADGTTMRASEGTGIGLSLVKELVQLHGGTISVASAPNAGSQFVVSLPQVEQGDSGGETPEAGNGLEPELSYAQLESAGLMSLLPAPGTEKPSASGNRASILVVEDNAEMREFIRTGIEPHYGVLEAADGSEGLAKAREHLPNLIICDVMMPGMDGYALCRALRDDTKLGMIPVVLLTAGVSQAMLIEGLEAGAIDYITKPFSFDVLLAKIGTLLRHEAKQEELALRDGLTGLLSRAAWELEVTREFSRISRGGGTASIAFLDIDDFKQVNDSHGHQAGDRVLRELATTIVDQVRATDLVGRYGGEEIVLLFPRSSAEASARTVERILRLFREKPIIESAPGCTFSAGVAEIGGVRILPISEYIARADAAMYQAKAKGKNRVTIWR